MKTHYFDKLNDEQLNQISALLKRFSSERAMNFDQLDGFFAGLHCCPDIIPPSIYLPEIWGGGEMPDEDAFENDQQSKDFFDLCMQHWNNASDRLNKDPVFLPALLDENSPGNDWSIGFLRGIDFSSGEWVDFLNDEEKGGSAVPILALANEHNPDPKLRPYEAPISSEQRETLLTALSAGVMKIFHYFSEYREFNARLAKESGVIKRGGPKIGRNSPCPCGSGKKYKKCCANVKVH